MKYAEAIEVCENIKDHELNEVLSAIEKILSMETINAVPKHVLLNIVRWFWDKCVNDDDKA